MNVNKEDYVAKIASANGAQLTVITYELAIAYTRQGCMALEQENEQNEGAFPSAVNNARRAVDSLIETLDMQYGISKTLLLIYLYVKDLLEDAAGKRRAEPLAEALRIMQTLLEAWEAVEHLGKGDPALMENAQQIYAGLTYKDGGLTEYVPENSNRGYKA